MCAVEHGNNNNNNKKVVAAATMRAHKQVGHLYLPDHPFRPREHYGTGGRIMLELKNREDCYEMSSSRMT